MNTPRRRRRTRVQPRPLTWKDWLVLAFIPVLLTLSPPIVAFRFCLFFYCFLSVPGLPSQKDSYAFYGQQSLLFMLIKACFLLGACWLVIRNGRHLTNVRDVSDDIIDWFLAAAVCFSIYACVISENGHALNSFNARWGTSKNEQMRVKEIGSDCSTSYSSTGRFRGMTSHTTCWEVLTLTDHALMKGNS